MLGGIICLNLGERANLWTFGMGDATPLPQPVFEQHNRTLVGTESLTTLYAADLQTLWQRVVDAAFG